MVLEHLAIQFNNELEDPTGFMPIINNANCWKFYITFICRSNFKACGNEFTNSRKIIVFIFSS